VTEFRNLRLPVKLRSELARPLGPVLSSSEAKEYLKTAGTLVTCGDVVTSSLLEWGLMPFIAVVDGKTTRSVEMSLSAFDPIAKRRQVKVKSPAGTLSAELQGAIRDLVREGGGLMVVEGEEDLAVLPLLIEMKLGTIVIYGQPGEGLVVVKVDEGAKRFAERIIREMEVN
jgi:hypothetical protein